MNIQRKVCLIGADGTGKTSIIVRYTKGTFSNSYLVTLGVDFYEVDFKKEVEGTANKLTTQIWDLASQKNFQIMRAQYLSYANFVIVVVDIRRNGDEYIIPWIEDLKKHSGEDVPYILVLNKIDLVDETLINEIADSLKKRYKVEVFKTSAKSGEMIKEMFEYVSEFLW